MAHKIKDFNLDGTYVERDATTDEKKFLQDKIDNKFNDIMESFSQTRNTKLAKTDWTDLPSSPLTDEKKSEWQTYRTNLRDITEGITTVEQARAVEFPTKPSGDN